MKKIKIVLILLLIITFLILFLEVSPFNNTVAYKVAPNTNVNVPVKVLTDTPSGGKLPKALPKSITEKSGSANTNAINTITNYANGVLNYNSPSGSKNVTQYTSIPVGNNEMYGFHTNDTDQLYFTDCITQYDADVRGITRDHYSQNIIKLAHNVCIDTGYTLLDPTLSGNLRPCTSTSVPDGYKKNGFQFRCRTYFSITINIPPLDTDLVVNKKLIYTQYDKYGNQYNQTLFEISSTSITSVSVNMNINGFSALTIPVIINGGNINFTFYFGNNYTKTKLFESMGYNEIPIPTGIPTTNKNNPFFLTRFDVAVKGGLRYFSNTVGPFNKYTNTQGSILIGNIIETEYIIISPTGYNYVDFNFPSITDDLQKLPSNPYTNKTTYNSAYNNYFSKNNYSFSINYYAFDSTGSYIETLSFGVMVSDRFDNSKLAEIPLFFIPLGGYIMFESMSKIVSSDNKYYTENNANYYVYNFLNPKCNPGNDTSTTLSKISARKPYNDSLNMVGITSKYTYDASKKILTDINNSTREVYINIY